MPMICAADERYLLPPTWAAPNVQNTLVGQYLMTMADYSEKPASTAMEAKATGAPVGPITLTPPMPSIVPPRAGQIDSSTAGNLSCGVNKWVTENPLMAVLGIVGVFYLVRGGGRRA